MILNKGISVFSSFFGYIYVKLRDNKAFVWYFARNGDGASTLPFALSVCSCCYAMSLRFRAKEAKANPDDDDEKNQKKQRMVVDLGNGSEVIYFPRIIKMEDSWKFFDYLNNRIPWNRPTIRVFGRSCLQVVIHYDYYYHQHHHLSSTTYYYLQFYVCFVCSFPVNLRLRADVLRMNRL